MGPAALQEGAREVHRHDPGEEVQECSPRRLRQDPAPGCSEGVLQGAQAGLRLPRRGQEGGRPPGRHLWSPWLRSPASFFVGGPWHISRRKKNASFFQLFNFSSKFSNFLMALKSCDIFFKSNQIWAFTDYIKIEEV